MRSAGSSAKRRKAYWRGRNAAKGFGKAKRKGAPVKEPPARRLDLAADQLKAVMRESFRPRALLNRPETLVFKALDKAVIARSPGHHQGSAAARDAVKKEALRKAGIGYHEVLAGHTTQSELRALVERLAVGIWFTESVTTLR